MKHYLPLLVFLLCIGHAASAQTDKNADLDAGKKQTDTKLARGLYKGYIVKYNNDTLRGYIKSPGGMERYRRADFVGNDGIEQRKLTAEDIRAYGFLQDSMCRFIRVEVPSTEKETEYFEIFGQQFFQHKNVVLYRHVLLAPNSYPALKNITKNRHTNLFFIKKPGVPAQLFGSELTLPQMDAYLGHCKAFTEHYPTGIEYSEKAIAKALMVYFEKCK
jgi:hypothetical protein